MNIRVALSSEIKDLNELIAESARSLCKQDYTPEEIESAIAYVFGVDTDLVLDKTYYVIEVHGKLVACGGWSKRQTLFGGNQFSSRDSNFLDPEKDPAKIRAFFVHPEYARKGLGKKLLVHCEEEAKRNGFSKVEMMATLTGVRLYQTQDYVALEQIDHELPNECRLKFMRMKKELPTLNYNNRSKPYEQPFSFLRNSNPTLPNKDTVKEELKNPGLSSRHE